MMKGEGNARGGKQKAFCGRGRGKQTNYQNTDLVVTVPNEESTSTRLKPPVTATRKIVRLNRKTESTDLEKVTVKSLDEIKREKEQRLLQRESSSTTTAQVAHATRSHDAVHVEAGGPAEVPGKDKNSFDNLNAAKAEPTRPCEPVAAAQLELQPVASNAIAAKPKPMMKDLTVKLKPLPAQSPSHYKILPGKQPSSAAMSSPTETSEVPMDFDSNMSEQDFDYSDSDDDIDEDMLLRDDEEVEAKQNSQNHQDDNDGSFSPYVDYSNVPLSHESAEEKEDDEISLHPDESLFDDEDEFSTNNNRLVRPRVLGRRSGSESKDLRALITDRQKQPQESSVNSTSTLVRCNEEEPETDNKETDNQEQENDVDKGKHENVLRQSHGREKLENVPPKLRRSERDLTRKSSDRQEGVRNRPRAVGGRVAHRNAVPRRGGRGSRPGTRRESGSNVAVPPILPLPIPNLFNTGGGLLPLPGTGGLLSQLQAHLNVGIQSLQTEMKKTVETLMNPPPVPGEHVPNYDKCRRQPSARLGSQGPRDSNRMNERHPPKRPQSSVPSAKDISPVIPEQVAHKGQVPPQKKMAPNGNLGSSSTQQQQQLPNWLQKMKSGMNHQQLANKTNLPNQETPVVKTGGEASQYESTENASQHDSMPPGCQNDYNNSSLSDVEKSRLARESRGSTDSSSEMLVSRSKRKSPFHGEDVSHGGKIVVTTSPEGLPQPGPARVRKPHPKGYCFRQLDTGHCTPPCKYRHLSNTELLEYQRSHQLGNTNSQDPGAEAKTEVQMEQTTAVVQEKQPEDEVPAVSYQLVTELLTKKNLGAAWQMVERLCRTNMPDFDVLRRTLVVCSEHLEEPDLAAKVACQAFDKIGQTSGQQHRHDYTVLIKTLCHSGQYIRAYEMLDAMKRNGHMPTYEVFLDLVQASAKDPDWAFNLLDEIRRSGLFKSGICSDLILLGCSSGEQFIERTWLLFQEALQSQVHLSAEAVQAMLLTLSQTNNWEKLMTMIPAYPDAVPIEILNTAVLTASRNADWVEMIVGLLAASPAERLNKLGPEVWNEFLSNCCTAHANKVSFAQKIYSLMQQNGIPLVPQTTNNYMRALSHANNWSMALELFNAAREDPKVLEQPEVLEGGLIALTTALSKGGAMVGMLTVVHFMLEHQMKPDNGVLQSAVESLDKEKNFKGVHQFFNQLKAAGIVPPLAVFRQIVSSLEKWIENPTASVEPYMAMRRAYPGNQSDAISKEEVSRSDNDTSEKHGRQICRYIATPRGCFSGNNCKFVHPDGGVSLPDRSNHSSGGSTPGSVTGSSTERRPSDTQGQSAPLGGIPSTSCQVAQPVEDHQISQIVPESLPHMPQITTANTMPMPEMRNPGSSQGPFRPEDATNSEASFKSMTSQNQSQGTVCHFFGTPQGCRNGDNCRFIHHQSSVSLSANSITVMSETVTGHSSGPVGHDQPGNPFVFKDPASSSGQAVGPGLFPPAHDQQCTASSGANTGVGVHSGGPFSSITRQRPVARQASGGGSYHFQLAGASHFTGGNPFSLYVPGRSRSMENFMGDRRATDQNHQSLSAPVVSEMPAVSHFQFPSKKSVHFYLPRIKHASEKQSWEDLGNVYVNMKNENVEIDYGMLQAFFHAFETNCLQTVGECFEKFSSQIHHHLEKRIPNPDPDRSPSALLDDDDKYFLGQLGVALMYLSYSKQLFNQGYTVLHVLHNFSINYSLYSGEFGARGRPLTTTEVALTAADICLNLNEPVYSSALEVLRGTNYALPAVGTVLTSVEAEWRRGVFVTMCQYFISSKEFDLVLELLDKVGDDEVFGSVEIKGLYNAVLRGLIKSNLIDDATTLLKRMGDSHISREPESVRALVNGFGDAGRTQDAKRYFVSGLFSGVYPPIFISENPWTVTVKVSFSALESKFYIEKHLNALQEFIEQNAHGVLDDNFYRPLTVVIKSDEVPSLYSRNNYMGRDEVICVTREKVRTVLSDDFNPPLSCAPQSNDEELVVSAMSLKRWFCANPSTGRFKGGSFGRASSQTPVERAPPYLQPGMSNVVSSNGLESESRKVSVFSKTDNVLPGLSSGSDGYQQHHLTRKNVHGQRFALSSSRKIPGGEHAKFHKFT